MIDIPIPNSVQRKLYGAEGDEFSGILNGTKNVCVYLYKRKWNEVFVNLECLLKFFILEDYVKGFLLYYCAFSLFFFWCSLSRLW